MSFEENYTINRLKFFIENGIAEIGDFSYGFPNVLHYGEDSKLKIGKFCSIAPNVNIFLGGNHRVDWVTTYPFSAGELNDIWPQAKNIEGHPLTKGDVVIGNDVWIGYGATIMSGVTIGDGAVIGSMAVVSRDVRPYSIIVGNPAREIKRRFDDETIENLINLKWWEWTVGKITSNLDILCSNNVKKIMDEKNINKSELLKNDRSFVYKSDINSKNINESRFIASEFISNKSVVLDVGCACGDLGKFLLDKKECSVYGMDIDDMSLNEARKTGAYRDVFNVNLNFFDEKQFLNFEKKFDFIIFADVLEHLLYPDKIINSFKKFLKDDGCFIVSMPNISHGSIKLSILRDEFYYTDTGILDKTHVKFFTHKSLPSFFSKEKLLIDELKITLLDENGNMEKDLFLSAPLSFKKEIFSNPYSFVCQYIMKISKSDLDYNQTLFSNKSKFLNIESIFLDDFNDKIKFYRSLKTEIDTEIEFIKSSKFWKLRNKYIYIKNGLKFILFSPGKFIKKYLIK